MSPAGIGAWKNLLEVRENGNQDFISGLSPKRRWGFALLGAPRGNFRGRGMKPPITTGAWSMGAGFTVLNLSPLGTFRQIADCFPYETIDGSGDHTLTEAEARANARAIALVPEMVQFITYIAGFARENKHDTIVNAAKTLLDQINGGE